MNNMNNARLFALVTLVLVLAAAYFATSKVLEIRDHLMGAGLQRAQ